MNSYLLTSLTLLPIAAGLLLLVTRGDGSVLRKLAIALSFLPLCLVALLRQQFDVASGALQFIERRQWFTSPNVEYFLGIDGIAFLMVLLTAIAIPFAVVATPREQQNRTYFALLFFLQAGLFGTFTALNFFHWFIFWELSLVPAFFLIKIWGGERRGVAALQFFIYAMVGSIAMLVAFVGLYIATDTFDFIKLAEFARNSQLAQMVAAKLGIRGLSTDTVLMILFAGVFLGFAVKVPLIPFHTWLPLTYSEAPTSTSMVLTSVISKMGVYGIIRVLLPIFPEQMRAVLTPLLWLAVATIVFSAYAAFAQKDLKRIVAYSSINHLGYCLLGLFAVVKSNDSALLNERAAALNGVVLQMFNHGITAAALFCFVGFLERRNKGARNIEDFGGMRKVAPVLCGLMGIAIFSSLGLPGLNGFVGEFLILKGAFSLSPWATALATLGLLATAIFLLTIIQKVFTGPVKENHSWIELTVGERLTVAPFIVLMFVFGIAPHLLLQVINPTILAMLSAVKP
jgi:NADH-quinone oxidoreductase subunit M